MIANILENDEVSSGYFRLILDSAERPVAATEWSYRSGEQKKLCKKSTVFPTCITELAQSAVPGQFVMIKVSENYDPLLRRPMGICRISFQEGNPCVDLIYQVVGRGTNLMSQMGKGQKIDLLGPFGNSFVINRNIKEAVFVAGGIGIAPLVMLTEKIKKDIPGIKTSLFIGGKSKDDILCIEYFEKLNTEITIATEDGSLGYQGLVIDPLEKFIDQKNNSETCIYACGPYKMLQAVSALAINNNIPCEVSLDRRMACGFGVCLGCVIKTNSNNVIAYKNVCADGPVFDAAEICW